jgi:hypothetical protein
MAKPTGLLLEDSAYAVFSSLIRSRPKRKMWLPL